MDNEIRSAEAPKLDFNDLEGYFNNSYDLLCIADTDGCFRRINPAWERTLGYAASELLGQSILNYVHPDDVESTIGAMGELRQGSEVAHFANRFRCQNGSYLHFEWHYYLVGDLIHAVARDVTDRKQKEIEERQRRQFLENKLAVLTQPAEDVSDLKLTDIFELQEIQKIQDVFSAATGVASVMTDTDGIPMTKPSNFCRLCSEIIRKTEKGRADCFQLDAFLGRGKPSGPIIQRCLSDGLWNGGTSINVGEHHIANWIIGQVLDRDFNEEKLIEYARAIGADEGEFRKALGEVPRMPIEQFEKICGALFEIANQLSKLAVQNVQQARFIAERNRAEEALKESEDLYRVLFENLNDGVFLMRGEIIFECNSKSTEIYRCSRNHLIGKSPLDLSPEYQPDGSLSRDKGQRQIILAYQGQPQCFEWQHVAENGELFFAEISLNRIEFLGEMILQAIVRDITDRKKNEELNRSLEEQLNQTQKMESVGRLAGGVAHDLNNMLTPILGYAELLLIDLSNQHPYRSKIETIKSAAERAQDLSRQLLAFARKQTLQMKPLDMNSIIQNFEKILKRTIREDVLIETNLSPNLPFFEGDISQIEQIILNLSVNAQDAMPNGGRLLIETGIGALDSYYAQTHEGVLPGDYVMLAVCDAGVGMDNETLQRVFEPFFTTKELGRGTGLGLSTVYGIVKQHKGHICSYSELGRGTIFKVYFPIVSGISASVAPTKEEVETKAGSEVILVVEDQSEVRKMACDILSRNGYKILEAEGGLQALSIVDSYQGKIDLVLTDVIMPDLNGRVLYQRLLEIRPGLRVIYMSGYTANVISHHGVLDSGINFIQKPFSLRELTAKVRTVLDQ